MAKVKGMKKLCKAVSAQLKPFGISKAVLSTEYSYVFADGSVTFNILSKMNGSMNLLKSVSAIM